MFSYQFTQYISIYTVITVPVMGIIYSRSPSYLMTITHREGADGVDNVTSGVDDGDGVVYD